MHKEHAAKKMGLKTEKTVPQSEQFFARFQIENARIRQTGSVIMCCSQRVLTEMTTESTFGSG
jgi:hypothetical protein